MSRLFVAVFPSEEAVDHLRRHLPAPAARRPEKWHVTLVFVGDVPDEDVPVLAATLAGVPAPGPISLRLAGAGRFGSVVWTGVHGDVDPLAAFREEVRSAVEDAGFPVDARPFRPHLTITYRYDRRLATTLDGYRGPSWSVNEIALVDSVDGDYLPLSTHPVAR
ncbi:RNA 2',3'-cyclic phosphodiesterase [Actinoplanes xinjiangensis]|uniref:RNA 2',3'-cyclic phosphodiesterase n=1 Tax=Actinoplanes xinjiangensis TaxID=512350 RepID=UPI0023B30428|nr:RNA 2',3'-cyclic phosphodiesterase [Actinoplanes xinjiangensis]